MKTNSVIAVGASLCAMLVGLAPAAQARARSCSQERAAGDYGYTNSGTIPARGGFDFLSVGRATLDAAGNISGDQTTSLNGIVVHETITGRFTVNADCTATAIINVFQGGTLVRSSPLDAVFVDDQNEIRAIVTTQGTAISVNIRRVFTAED